MITSRLLFDYLSQNYSVRHLGARLYDTTLGFPVLYRGVDTSVVPGGAYVADSSVSLDLVNCNCLFLCIGKSPPELKDACPFSVFFISDYPGNISDLLQELLRFWEMLLSWIYRTQSIILQNGTVSSLIEASIPVFENGIVILDQDFNVEAFCGADRTADLNGQVSLPPPIVMRTVPDFSSPLLLKQFRSSFSEHFQTREPFLVQFDYFGKEISCFCINLFYKGSYNGCCILCEICHPITSFDQDLFAVFAEIASHILSSDHRFEASYNRLRSVFNAYLEERDVSGYDLKHIILRFFNGQPPEPLRWRCLHVFRSDIALPKEVISAQLQHAIPHSVALTFDDSIAVLACDSSLFREERERLIELSSGYELIIGVSVAFSSLSLCRQAMNQAKACLELNHRVMPSTQLFFAEEDLSGTMLNCILPQFGRELVVPPDLEVLLQNSVLRETLKVYLDSESNASQAANKLFVHRSTLTHRLEQILKLVPLDTPEQRLHVRMCLRLYEMTEGRHHTPPMGD